MKFALLGLFVLLSLFSLVKPYTKEKFFFVFVTLLMAYLMLSTPDQSIDDIRDDAAAKKRSSAKPQDKFAMELEKGVGKVPAVDQTSREGEERIKGLREGEYLVDSGSKSLYRLVVRIQPLGRIRMGGPSTPGITVLTGYSSLGPSLRGLPARVPLGVLDPESGQMPPDLPR